jgi:hypothetical protein
MGNEEEIIELWGDGFTFALGSTVQRGSSITQPNLPRIAYITVEERSGGNLLTYDGQAGYWVNKTHYIGYDNKELKHANVLFRVPVEKCVAIYKAALTPVEVI